MPVKPRRPATIEIRKKSSAHLRIVIARSFGIPPPDRRRYRNRESNFGRWDWFPVPGEGRGAFDCRPLTDVNYCPTFAGKPGWAGSSPGRPLGNAPVPNLPGVDVSGTPG